MESLAGIQIFLQVVEAGSFSAAGRRLNLAASSVSRQVGELEDQLGARLLVRTTRRLRLTEAGQVYFDRAKRIIEEVEESRLALSQLGSPSGVLRVTAPSGVGREVIVSAVSQFVEVYPAVQVVISMTDHIVDLVESGIDVAIRVGRPRDSTLRVIKIGESRRVVCASPRYLERRGTPHTPNELVEHNCLTWRDHPGESEWVFKGDRGPVKVRVKGNMYAHNADALVAGALAGMGLVLLPDWNLGAELRSKSLQVVLENHPPIPAKTPIHAIHAHPRHVPPKVRAFIDYMKARLAEVKLS